MSVNLRRKFVCPQIFYKSVANPSRHLVCFFGRPRYSSEINWPLILRFGNKYDLTFTLHDLVWSSKRDCLFWCQNWNLRKLVFVNGCFWNTDSVTYFSQCHGGIEITLTWLGLVVLVIRRHSKITWIKCVHWPP